MLNDKEEKCEHSKHSLASYNNHSLCLHCRIAAGKCQLDYKKPCSVCQDWLEKRWKQSFQEIAD